MEIKNLESFTWMIYNILSNKPFPDYQISKQILPIMVDLLLTQKHFEILKDSSWSIVKILDACDDNAKETQKNLNLMLESNVDKRLIELINQNPSDD